MATLALVRFCALLSFSFRVVDTLLSEGVDESCSAHIGAQHGIRMIGRDGIKGGDCSSTSTDFDCMVMLQVSRKTRRPLRVLFVRHAESYDNALWKDPGMTAAAYAMQREADPEITALGITQAQALGDFLARGADNLPSISILRHLWPIGQVYVSPMMRTLQTLQVVAGRMSLGPTPALWTDIFETRGVYELHDAGLVGEPGLGRSQILQMLPAIDIAADVTEVGWYKLPTSESSVQIQDRVASVAAHLRELAAGSSPIDGSVMLVTHGNFSALVLEYLLGSSAWAAANGGHVPCRIYSNTAMTMVEIQADGRAQVLFQNRTDHLSADKVTGSWASC